MTIAEVREKCKRVTDRAPQDVLIIGIMVLASSASFGLGYLAGRDMATDSSQKGSTAVLQKGFSGGEEKGQVVASKSGTKYYFPSCSGADRISEGNKVWFASVAAAEEAGYTRSANCEGI